VNSPRVRRRNARPSASRRRERHVGGPVPRAFAGRRRERNAAAVRTSSLTPAGASLPCGPACARSPGAGNAAASSTCAQVPRAFGGRLRAQETPRRFARVTLAMPIADCRRPPAFRALPSCAGAAAFVAITTPWAPRRRPGAARRAPGAGGRETRHRFARVPTCPPLSRPRLTAVPARRHRTARAAPPRKK
jgi:hypothetical protein